MSGGCRCRGGQLSHDDEGQVGGSPASDELGARPDRLPRGGLVRQHPSQDRHGHLAEGRGAGRGARRGGGGSGAGGGQRAPAGPAAGDTTETAARSRRDRSRGDVRARRSGQKAGGDLERAAGRVQGKSEQAGSAQAETEADEGPRPAGPPREIRATAEHEESAALQRRGTAGCVVVRPALLVVFCRQISD